MAMVRRADFGAKINPCAGPGLGAKINLAELGLDCGAETKAGSPRGAVAGPAGALSDRKRLLVVYCDAGVLLWGNGEESCCP